YHIGTKGRSVVFVKTGASTAGSLGTPDESEFSGTGTVTFANAPADDFEIVVEFLSGATFDGTGSPDADVSYRESLDGGRTFSGTKTYATTDTEITIADSGGVTLAIDTGTTVAGDKVSVRATALNFNATEIGDAIAAMGESAIQWDLAEVVGPLDGSLYDAVETAFAALEGKAWIGQFRTPDEGETEAQYLTAFSTALGAKADTSAHIVAGAAEITSSVSLRKYRRSPVVTVASLAGSVTEEVDLADVNLGALTGVSIRDANGNPKHHDELINPGLDDARAIVLRTFDGAQGVYVNNPNTFSANGSDFELLQHRRVMNRAKRALRGYFTRRLSKPIAVNASTGFILESEALEIEAGANAILRGVLLAKPKASAATVTLSRDDNLLSTKTLTG
ncbi:MAG: hypothetical protein GWN84_23555, partial [Gammaproteobacteria bacterium]|nr:hypothetical protein [Gammaproteobacteria bacterium]NIU06707.1 hypothetical protein [Gammaproteobacteria bacterium]NIV53538.1 hypothetical protein [Gammaproteobacteria bacterium]NIX87980.1 hypothetical protein [Gammaproteobacteria bacterium]